MAVRCSADLVNVQNTRQEPKSDQYSNKPAMNEVLHKKVLRGLIAASPFNEVSHL